MSVPLEFINLIIKRAAIEHVYPGGWEGYLKFEDDLVGKVVFYDDDLVRNEAMSSGDLSGSEAEAKGNGGHVHCRHNERSNSTMRGARILLRCPVGKVRQTAWCSRCREAAHKPEISNRVSQSNALVAALHLNHSFPHFTQASIGNHSRWYVFGSKARSSTSATWFATRFVPSRIC